MSKALYIPIIVVIFLLSAPCVAPAEEQPAQEEFPEISTATLKIRLDTAPNFVLIDVRTEEEYVEGHIPKAINIPPDKLKNIEDYLPDDRELPLVFYCSGYVWRMEVDAAVAAKNAGYDNVLVYLGGYPAWTHAGLPVEKGSK